MDQRINQLMNEIIRLTEHLQRETQESQGYVQRGDKNSALRNQNDSRDELATLNQKWQQLTQLLQNS